MGRAAGGEVVRVGGVQQVFQAEVVGPCAGAVEAGRWDGVVEVPGEEVRVAGAGRVDVVLGRDVEVEIFEVGEVGEEERCPAFIRRLLSARHFEHAKNTTQNREGRPRRNSRSAICPLFAPAPFHPLIQIPLFAPART